MYIDSYVQDPRTAGISIFHDGLPKLASVHCYDRGNIATFGLQSCPPRPLKDPPKLYPIRPVVNHYSPKVPLVNQPRMYNGIPQPHVNQPKMYSGAFYPPGSQPRVQRIDGRPVLLPSTFNNTFIHKECFDPNVNKSNSVVYNGPYPPANCCMQYGSMDPCHAFQDDASKQLMNMRPDNPNTMPFTMSVDVRRPRMENALNNMMQPHEYCDIPPDSQHFPRKIAPQSFNCENPSMVCNPMNSSVNYSPGNQPMMSELGNAPMMYKSAENPGLACKYTDIIDLVADEEFKEKCSINQKQYDNHTQPPNKYNSERRADDMSCDSNGYKTNNNRSNCSSCHKECSVTSRLNHMNAPLNIPSEYNDISSPLCTDCNRQRTLNESKQNPSCSSAGDVAQNDNITRIFPRTKSNLSNRPRRPDNINLLDPSCNGTGTQERSSIVKDSSQSNGVCSYCNKNIIEGLVTPRTHPACQSCIGSWHRGTQQNITTNVSQRNVNGNTGNLSHLNSTSETAIVIDVDNYSKEECKTNQFNEEDFRKSYFKCSTTGGFKHANQYTNVRSRSEDSAYINTNHEENRVHKKCSSVPLMEYVVVKTEPSSETNITTVNRSNDNAPVYTTTEEDDFDIDEKSFDTFINNTRSETESPSFHSNSPNAHSENIESSVSELNRKRKSPFMASSTEKSGERSDKCFRSNPNSPTYHIDQEKLVRLRNKVTPILKAKKWIRQNSLDTPTDELSASILSDL